MLLTVLKVINDNSIVLIECKSQYLVAQDVINWELQFRIGRNHWLWWTHFDHCIIIELPFEAGFVFFEIISQYFDGSKLVFVFALEDFPDLLVRLDSSILKLSANVILVSRDEHIWIIRSEVFVSLFRKVVWAYLGASLLFVSVLNRLKHLQKHHNAFWWLCLLVFVSFLWVLELSDFEEGTHLFTVFICGILDTGEVEDVANDKQVKDRVTSCGLEDSAAFCMRLEELKFRLLGVIILKSRRPLNLSSSWVKDSIVRYLQRTRYLWY